MDGNGASPRPMEAFAALELALVETQKVLTDGIWQLTESDVCDLARRHHVLLARAQAVNCTIVAELSSRGTAASHGATSTPALLSQMLRVSPGSAHRQSRMTELLGTTYPRTGAALTEGVVCEEQARAIVDVLDGLPRKATAEDKARAEQFLLDKASIFHAADLRRLGKKLDDVLDQDGTPEREQNAKSKRALGIRDHGDGTQTLRWRDTDENVAAAKAALESLAAPVPAEDGARDTRSAPVRRADAMVDLVRQVLRFGDLPASRGVRPHLHVTVTADVLRGRGFGRTATGEDLSAATIDRLACDADVTGILLGGDGVPLKVGRTRRTVTRGQWVALVARDSGCVFPGCTRPAAWCDAHHIRYWRNGGRTDLDNLVLLCGVHHDYVHHRGWRVRLDPGGRPELLPPPWVDPTGAPRANTYWRAQQHFRDFPTAPDP